MKADPKLMTVAPTTQPGPGRNYGRSMVISQQGIVATSHTLASQAGAQILADGGSAVDAAIAANVTLGVVEPMMNGIGGDLFALYWDAKEQTLTGLNASGPAPRALSLEFLATCGIATMDMAGIHAVTVPGAVAGWARMHQRFGKTNWRQLFEPGIAYAEQGFPVSEAIAEQWAAPSTAAKLIKYPESVRVFLPCNRAPMEGDLFFNPDLGRAYRTLAHDGDRSFYEGKIAEAILSTARDLGGLMSPDDLRCFSPEWVDPVCIDYRGWKIYELPPNGQGMAALEMLNIMETLSSSPGGAFTPDEQHKRIEAMKLAYADLYRYCADPRACSIPVATLLSKDYARRRASLIDPAKANGEVRCGDVMGSDTVYLAVVDREGNIASWIQSIFHNFGSAITVNGMGFTLQNRGGCFTLDPEHPNVLAGGKRPFHTIIPGFMESGSRHIGFGIMGGPNQPLAHAQFVSNFVDYGMNLQQAMESPRFTRNAATGFDALIESRIPAATLERLSAMGHELSVRPEYTQEMGRGQAVMHDSKTRINYGASDPRADGAATPEPIRVSFSQN
jgi:gamma-glutamyltranspeptidase/glutathione hydrolase